MFTHAQSINLASSYCINNNQIEISNHSYLLCRSRIVATYATTDNIYDKVIEKGREKRKEGEKKNK